MEMISDVHDELRPQSAEPDAIVDSVEQHRSCTEYSGMARTCSWTGCSSLLAETMRLTGSQMCTRSFHFCVFLSRLVAQAGSAAKALFFQCGCQCKSLLSLCSMQFANVMQELPVQKEHLVSEASG